MAPGPFKVTKVGVIGAGSMGSSMALLFAEKGYQVACIDPSKESREKLNKQASDIHLADRCRVYEDYETFTNQNRVPDTPALYLLSIPHGDPADKVIASLRPHLQRGDIVLDCGNEHWKRTERRQTELADIGVSLVGCGVSGGYQSARAGPSMSPGGDAQIVQNLIHFLQDVAAKNNDNEPCVALTGPRGSGHYVKTIHNGIEQGMMGILAEVWYIFVNGLGMTHDEVRDVFQQWDQSGPLRGSFLVHIGIDILQQKDNEGKRVLDSVRDKVVQDVDDSEGTGVWTCEEAATLHIPAPTIVAAHQMRCASAHAALREQRSRQLSSLTSKPARFSDVSREEFIGKLHDTVAYSFMSCFAQGLNILEARNQVEKWQLDYKSILKIWSNGCIIRSDGIHDVLHKALDENKGDSSSGIQDFFCLDQVAQYTRKYAGALKSVVLKSIEADMILPCISQTLEHFKYTTSTHLPTQYMEAQLDAFGQHMFDTWDDPPGGPKKGSHHHEWLPARGGLGGGAERTGA